MAGVKAATLDKEVEATCRQWQSRRTWISDSCFSGHTSPGFLLPDFVYMRNKLLSGLNTCCLGFLSLRAKSNSNWHNITSHNVWAKSVFFHYCVTMDLSFFSLYQKEAKTFPFNRYSLQTGNLETWDCICSSKLHVLKYVLLWIICSFKGVNYVIGGRVVLPTLWTYTENGFELIIINPTNKNNNTDAPEVRNTSGSLDPCRSSLARKHDTFKISKSILFYFSYFPPALLRCYWHVTLYKCEVYGMIIWHT